jgi:hypothetical protein
MQQPDQDKLDAFLGRMVGDHGSVAISTLLLPGDRLGLGAQAGELKRRQVVPAGGFSRFRRFAETPFNMVLEARP